MRKTVIYTFIIICVLSVTSCEAVQVYSDDEALAAGVFSVLVEDTPLPAVTVSDGYATEADVDLLIHLVSSEAGEFPYMTQVCFAAMVLNRVEDPYFPRGIRGVVFESGDFASVLMGKVTGTLPEGFKGSKKYRIAKKAVEEAASGYDPTDGAVYFSTGARKNSQFSPSYECGGMSFGS